MNIFLTLLSQLPLSILYRIAVAVDGVLFHLLRYRRVVVESNLEKCFPQMSVAERAVICRKTYRNLSEVLLETIKMNTLSHQAIQQRCSFLNEEVLRWQERPVIFATAHFANWEWLVRHLAIASPHPAYGLYKPLHNRSADRFVMKVRGKQTTFFSKQEIVQMLKSCRQAFSLGIIADQSPSDLKAAVWVDFLGRETAFSTGLARISAALKAPVFYIDLQRTAQGMYQARFIELGVAQKGAEQAFMRSYAEQLEQSIRSNPEQWIWSHRRWKHARQDESST